jgi:hypothetical protein
MIAEHAPDAMTCGVTTQCNVVVIGVPLYMSCSGFLLGEGSTLEPVPLGAIFSMHAICAEMKRARRSGRVFMFVPLKEVCQGGRQRRKKSQSVCRGDAEGRRGTDVQLGAFDVVQ